MSGGTPEGPPPAGGDLALTELPRTPAAPSRAARGLTARLKAALGCWRGGRGPAAPVRDQEALLRPEELPGLHRPPVEGLWFNIHFWRWAALVVLILIMIAVTVINLIHLTIVRRIAAKEPPKLEPCPYDWMYYRRTCYYFSDFESDWNSSQAFCSALGASLALIRNHEQLDFLSHRMWFNPPWIGLHRSEGEMQWVNRIPLNTNKFTLQDSGDCAYVNASTIYLSECGSSRSFVCTMGRSHLGSNFER
ncbi:C-type lectin domain family 2 member L-like [Lissotriton helveticus]